MKLRKFLFACILASLFVIAVGCQESDEEAATEGGKDGEDQSENLSGDVVIDGSGTVYPLMAKLAEEYMVNEGQEVSVEVSRSGTSAGFKKFLVENGTDFNNASREIKDEEQALAEDLNLEVEEFKVALDGLTFVINKDNAWATEMTEEELKEIFLASSSIEKWSELREDWPDEPINTYGPNENHGTYEFFYENILEEADLKEDINLQQEYSTLVNLIADDQYGIAFFGYGYYASNTDSLQAVKVDFGEGPVEPTLETIAEDGPYGNFTRPVFTYLNVAHAKEKPQVLDFAKFVFENLNDYAGETGFAPLPDEEVEESLRILEELKN